MTWLAMKMKPVPPAIAKKLVRLKRGGRPRTLDLFSGCGGLSLGFHAAGFEIVGAVEADRDAAKSFAVNFDQGRNPGFALPKDIRSMEPEEVLRLCGAQPGPARDAVDVVIGGPPCQAYARIGRAKLRQVGMHPEAFKRDPRAELYIRYIHFVRKTQPLMVLIENVPDVLNFGGRNIAEEIVGHLKELGYSSRYTLLNAAHYGVPQARDRMFLVGIHRGCDFSFRFPAPSRTADLPAGYGRARAIVLGAARLGGGRTPGAPAASFVAPPDSARRLAKATTSSDALTDLPRIDARRLMSREGTAGFKKLRIAGLPYEGLPLNQFQRLMRAWPGIPRSRQVVDHSIRCLPRDFRWFARMRAGMRYPAILSIATKAFHRDLLPRLRRSGIKVPRLGTAAFKRFMARYVPPYDPGKFPDKWRMIDPARPCHTLLAHLSKDCYSHIHYDALQARTISVRESARLQSFPDGFRFVGAMNSAFRQIGNAVPPMLSMALAVAIKEALNGGGIGHPWVTDEMGREASSVGSRRSKRDSVRKA